MEVKSTAVRSNVRPMVMCALFTALTAVGAFIKIPIPVIPFTMQVLFTTLAGLLIGKKYGAISMVLYMVIGLIGIPIFTQGGGISYVFKPTFGYIVGFCFGTYVTGAIASSKSNPSYIRLLMASFAGVAVIYVFGMIYFYVLSNFVIGNTVAIKTVLVNCFLMTIGGDILSCFIAALIAKRTIPFLRKRGLSW